MENEKFIIKQSKKKNIIENPPKRFKRLNIKIRFIGITTVNNTSKQDENSQFSQLKAKELCNYIYENMEMNCEMFLCFIREESKEINIHIELEDFVLKHEKAVVSLFPPSLPEFIYVEAKTFTERNFYLNLIKNDLVKKSLKPITVIDDLVMNGIFKIE